MGNDSLVVMDRIDLATLTLEQPDTGTSSVQTLEHMKAGIPFIFNGFLINRSEGIYDVADLLIRSDYVRRLFPDYSYTNTVGPKAKSQFGPWHYLAVGIRFSRNTFCVDGLKLRNDLPSRYWKVKLYIQNRILDYYQHYRPSCALLIGRGFTWTQPASTGGQTVKSDSFLKPGEIQFEQWDQFTKQKYQDGRSWMEKLSLPLAAEWKVSPVPAVPELYANAKLSIYDTPWSNVIKGIAREQDDITLLHHCTVDNRVKAHSAGIMTLSQVTRSEDVGFKSTTQLGQQLNRFFSKSFDNLSDVVVPLPDATYQNRSEWITLDFESLATGLVVSNDHKTLVEQFVYLVAIEDRHGVIQFGIHQRQPVAEGPAAVSALSRDYVRTVERDIASSLWDYLEEQDPAIIYCWGDAEARYLYHLEARYPEYPLGSEYAHRLVDLHDTFSKYVLPGQTDSSLETISKVVGCQPKEAVNTDVLAETYLFSDNADNQQQAMSTLLQYNAADVQILSEIITKMQE